MRALLPAVLAAAAAAASCGGGEPIAGEGLVARASTEAAEIESGRSFPLTVVRSWPRGEEPPPWRDAALAPLAVRTLSTRLRDDGRRVEETRALRAWAFEPGETRVLGSLALRVRPSVDPANPGAPEPPEGPLDPPDPGAWLLAAAAALLAAGLLVTARRLAPGAPAPPPRPDPSAAARARAAARLAALRGRGLPATGEARPFHEEAAALLRDWLEEGHGVPAGRRTSPEIAADPGTATALGAERVPVLARALDRCDLVKFAGLRPTEDAARALLDDAGALLGERP